MKLSTEQLVEFVSSLEKNGYKKINGHYKSEDYGYWKTDDGYQIAILVYDFTKFPTNNVHKSDIGIQYEFLLNNNPNIDRMDLTVSDKKLTVQQFENICNALYKNICHDLIFKK